MDYNGNSTSPDKLDLFDVSDLNNPFLVGSYNFPTNHQANANYIGQAILAGNRVFALEGNNGIVAYTILGPQLSISGIGNKVVLSWSTNVNGSILKSATKLSPSAAWSSAGTPVIVGNTYVVTNAISGSGYFYRLSN